MKAMQTKNIPESKTSPIHFDSTIENRVENKEIRIAGGQQIISLQFTGFY